MSNDNPFRANVAYSRTTWILGIIIAVVVVFGIGYYLLYSSAPSISNAAKKPAVGGSPTPSTLPTPAPSTPTATPK
jgi:hypothetical protein